MLTLSRKSPRKKIKDKEKINKKWRKAPWNLVQFCKEQKNGKCKKVKTVCGYDRWKNGWKVCKNVN